MKSLFVVLVLVSLSWRWVPARKIQPHEEPEERTSPFWNGLCLLEVIMMAILFVSTDIPKMPPSAPPPVDPALIDTAVWGAEQDAILLSNLTKMTAIHFDRESDKDLGTRLPLDCPGEVRPSSSGDYLSVSLSDSDTWPCGREVVLCSETTCLHTKRYDTCFSCIQGVLRLSAAGVAILCDGEDYCQVYVSPPS